MQSSANGLYLQTYNYNAINDIWHEIKPLISKLIFKSYNGKYKPEDILKRIISNKQQIWLARELASDAIVMVCITEIAEYPQKKTLIIYDVVGEDLKRWLWIDEIITNWAKEIGCSIIESQGRLGWLKRVPNSYKAKKIIFEKEL